MRSQAEALLFRDDDTRLLRRHIANLELQLRTMEAESCLLAARWQAIERKNAALANLYVAIHQIHGTLVRAEVIEAMIEILVGLVGSEALAIYERSGDGARFVLVGSFGVDADDERELSACCDPLGRVLASGARYVAGEPHPLPGADDASVAAALPLCLGGRVTGGIVLFSLLAQKRGLDDVDHELFELLSHHGALALHCTALLETGVGA